MTAQAFGSVAIRHFKVHTGTLLREGLGIGPAVTRDFTELVSARLRHEGGAAFDKVSSFLRMTGLRDRWNAALGFSRSEALGEWIAPHVQGSVLDLLCGSGGVGRALQRRGVNTTFTEHGKFSSHAVSFDTVLICTNLHHEEDSEALLALGARLARRRLILIENCIEKDFPGSYQLLMDLFFNRCLNPNDLGSPGTHRTAADWIRSAGVYGDLVRVEQRRDIPGIPLGHHLIVVDIDRGRQAAGRSL